MLALERIAERRISEAVANGELDGLPGAGRRLDLDDVRDVPPELRAAYRILKNAGFAPDEVGLRASIHALEAHVAGLGDAAADRERRAVAERRLALLRMRLEACGGRLPARYVSRLLDRLE